MADAQQAMVELIRARGIQDERVLQAMAQVPRHQFVKDQWASSAYSDSPLPIGHQQTISQPYIVAFMTESLSAESGDRVLEIGTGSGYQAAVLAEMGMEVYTIERVPELYETARSRLETLRYNVQCCLGDGYYGWPEFAPYQGIIVAAAPPEVPQPLIDQLADNGRMIIPVGPSGGYQSLWEIIKREGKIERYHKLSVAFVPFVHNT